jgi:energy-coupling factor transporter transmembrane protein EcfT
VSDNGPLKDKKHDLWGWLLFVISALFFIASSIRNGDMIGLLGGIFFLLACVVFLGSYIGFRKG